MPRRSPGEGSLTQRTDGRWQASLQVDGRRRIVYGKTRSEAAAKLDELKRQVARAGVLPCSGRRALDDLLTAWLEIKTPALKPRTLHDYQDACDRYLRPSLGKVRLDRLTPDRIQRLYARYQAAGQHCTALKCHRVLSQALALAVRWGWLAANPCDRVDAPRYRPERKAVWTAEQLRRFLDGTADHWLGPLWTVLACSGMRLGEALALTWADVDLGAGTIRVAESKTEAGIRTVKLPPLAMRALRRQAEAQLKRGHGWARVFTALHGGRLEAGTVEGAMRRQCEWLGLPRLSPHGLRHLHASLLLAEGLPLPEVSRRMGHANAAITAQVYSHAVRDDSAAAEAMARALERG